MRREEKIAFVSNTAKSKRAEWRTLNTFTNSFTLFLRLWPRRKDVQALASKTSVQLLSSLFGYVIMLKSVCLYAPDTPTAHRWLAC